MAKRNEAFGVQFNDNDGGAGFFYSGATLYDHKRHLVIYGKWRTRWMFLRIFWQAMIGSEEAVKTCKIQYP